MSHLGCWQNVKQADIAEVWIDLGNLTLKSLQSSVTLLMQSTVILKSGEKGTIWYPFIQYASDGLSIHLADLQSNHSAL